MVAAVPEIQLQEFGKYILVRKLAEGGMAEIFLAKQVGPEGFERNVVIKRMHSHLSSSPEFVQMFLDEARLAARLAHPNVVQINDLGRSGDHYFIAMEYLSGEDLSGIIRHAKAAGQTVPFNILLRIFIDACDGLHHAHEYQTDDGRNMGIVHRDISPSNLFVTYSGPTKVLDFGIAKASSRVAQTSAGTVKGKFIYMSPQQALGEPVDRRADIWALGVSLYESVTGLRIFQRENDLAIMKALCFEPIPPASTYRPDLPPPLDKIIARAMTRELAQRYQSCAEMKADLEQFASMLPRPPGGVPGYLRQLFGEDRARARSTVPTLASLKQRLGEPTSNPSSAGIVPTMGAGPRVASAVANAPTMAGTALPISAGPAPAPASGKNLGLVVGAVGLVALGLGGGLAFHALSGKPADPPPVAVAPPAPTPAPTPAPKPTPPVAVDPKPVTNPAVPANTQPAPTPTPTANPPVEHHPRPVVALQSSDIQQGIARRRAQILGCFQQGRAGLSNTEGKVQITFTIVSSGKVTSAHVDTPEFATSAIGACIEAQVKKIEFPRNKDKEVTISVPFLYRVTQ